MERRWGPLRIGLTGLAGLLASWGMLLGSASESGASSVPRRTISVTVLADVALETNEVWKVDIFRAVRDASQALEEVSRTVLKIRAYDYWAPGLTDVPGGGRRSPRSVREFLVLLNRRIREAGRGGSELVIGLVPEGPDGPVIPGIADYINGAIVIKYLNSRGGIPFVLLHEICHILGAIDLKTNGSVMSLRDPGFGIDAFSRTIMRANRLRSFLDGAFPLTGDGIPAAIDIYESRQALGLGEDELGICVGKLRAVLSGQGFSFR